MVNKKFIIFGIVSILLIGFLTFVYAQEFSTIDKTYTKTPTADLSTFIKEDFNTKYGAITLSDSAKIGEKKMAEFSLISNTEKCLDKCFQHYKATLYQPMSLFDKVDYNILQGEGSLSSIPKVTIKYNETYYEEVIDKIMEKCEDISNKTFEGKYCYNITLTTKNITKTRDSWKEYNGEILPIGNYEYQITGKLERNQIIDVVQTTSNKQFTEWTTWTASDCIGIGGTITIDGDYCVHTYLTSSSFNLTTTNSINATVLVVAGGGGGGFDLGGGGGGGGLIYTMSVNVSANTTVSIGLGGGPASATSMSGYRGQNSSFGTTIALGGGGGKSRSGIVQSTGGSGGGGSYAQALGALGTVNQGKNGGNLSASYGCGGGGGAGALGGTSGSDSGGNGGVGLAYTINGTSNYYAGGGGGGAGGAGSRSAGGLGGGGAGGKDAVAGVSGINGTGGGGGGGGSSGAQGAGGSGVVIVRYLAGYPNIVVTMNYPLDNQVYTNTSQLFNCSAFNTTRLTVQVWNDTIINGLVAYYDFEETSGVRLKGWNGVNNGSNSGATISQSSKLGNSYLFNGNKYVTINNTPQLSIANNAPMTISAWVNVSRFPVNNNWGMIVGKDHNVATSTSPYEFRIQNTSGLNLVYFGAYNGSDFSTTWNSGTGLTDKDYHNLVGQYNGTAWLIYYDGVLKNFTANAFGPKVNALNVSIGAFFISGAYARFFNGSIDDVGIWNRSLSASEVLDIYNDGNASRGLITRYSNSSAIDGDYVYTDSLAVGQHYTRCISRNSVEQMNTTSKISFNITSAVTNCWTKTSTLLFIPTGCVYNIASGGMG